MEFETRLQALRARLLKAWAPPEKLKVSEWADKYRRLSPEASAEPGPWNTDRAPYQREIMDALCAPECQEVVLEKPTQIGATEILNNLAGYYMDHDPSPMLVLQPNQKPMGEAWSKDRLAPMIRDTPRLKAKVADAKSRDSDNTILHKSFPGGHITVVGANAPSGLASRPVRVLLSDECNRYPVSAGVEGDAISLGRRRLQTFWNRKAFYGSTPTLKGASRITAMFEGSSREYLEVECHGCETYTRLEWDHVSWVDDDPSTATYACPHCGVTWTDADRWANIRRAHKWVPENPEQKRVRGFRLNALASPWVTVEEFVQEYLDAKDDPELYKVWVNTFLGLPYEEGGDQEADGEVLHAKRRHLYDAFPVDAQVVTVGADVQGDRIEAETLAVAPDMRTWSIDYQVFFGDPRIPSGEPGSPWDELEAFYKQTWTNADGAELRTWAVGIDANYLSDEVYRFVKRRKRQRVYAVRGRAGMGLPALVAKGRSHNRKSQAANMVDVYTLGVDTLKGRVYRYLSVDEPELPGYCAFPERYELPYFDQLAAERAIRRVKANNRVVIEWTKTQNRNEALDCRVYAMGVLEIRRPRWKKAVETAQSSTPVAPVHAQNAPNASRRDTPERPEAATTRPAKRRPLRIGGR